MHEFWIRREADDEIVANYLGKDARDALVKFVKDEGGSITQDQHGRRYFAEINGQRYFADRA